MKVVLLHAFPLDERMWEPQLEPLREYDVAAPCLYGRGSTIAEIASSLLAEHDGELALVGASLGGYTALELAHQEPARVRALVLVGARADADTPERRAARADTIALVEDGGAEALWEKQRPLLLLETAPEAAVERARQEALDRSRDELVAAVGALRDREDHTGTLSAFAGPALVAVGEGDLFFPPDEARAQAQLAPHGRYREFAGAGHLPSLEQPDEFNAALAQFLADV
ncbi:MAG TPA: alpha/beta fold hydrolase [Gaiellaceae bacterium]|nr:alpha/beta fold hydrolase [Gaiellaceae bacterium]